MKAPDLNRSLILEAAERTPDGQGGYATVWRALGRLWGDVDPGTGRAAPGFEVSLSRVRYRITVRAAPQGAPSRPLPGQRLRDGQRIFAIRAVTESAAGAKYLDCFAEEEVAQ